MNGYQSTHRQAMGAYLVVRGSLPDIGCNDLSILSQFLKLLKVWLKYSWAGSSFAKTVASVVPHKDIYAHLDIVVKPVALVLEKLSKPCIWVAKDHSRVVVPLTCFLSRTTIIIPAHIFVLRSEAGYPVSLQSCFIGSGKEDLLCSVSQFHLNSHLLEGPEGLSVEKLLHRLLDSGLRYCLN